MNSFSFAALTDVGTVRTNNEDSALASCTLLAVADGMGGHAAGEVASAVVMHALARLLDPEAEIGPDSVREATFEARQALRAMSAADQDMEGMGTTLVAVAVGPTGTTLAHVGDSRIYRARGGEVTQITTDHTHVQRLVDSGRLDPREVRNHPYRSVILRSIDDTSDDLPDVDLTGELVPGDRVLLCSDGLSDYVSHELLVAALLDGSPLEAARELMAGALRAGTRDNVTVIVADVHDPELEPRALPPEPPVVVGASLGHTALTEEARTVLVDAFPDVAALMDTLPRGERGQGEHQGDERSDDVVEGVAAPDDTVEGVAAEEAEVTGDELEQRFGPLRTVEKAHDPGDSPAVDGDTSVVATSPAPRTTTRDVIWLALVVATFAAVTAGVWFLES